MRFGQGKMALETTIHVSVIVPTRNRPALLRAALGSLLAQSKPVDQIVVVDDASDSTDWLAAVAAMSPVIEVVREERNRGVSAARNHGLDRARGEYIMFLDDDDLVDPRFVEAGLAVLTADRGADGVFFRYQTTVAGAACDGNADLPFLAEGETRASPPVALLGTENPVHGATLERRPVTAFLRYLIPINSGFVRRSAIGAARFPEVLRQGEDTYFWISLAAAGRRFVLDEHAYAIVRRHAGNTTRSRVRYLSEIQPCYERLLSEGLLAAPDDVFLAHLKLLWFKTLTGGKGAGRHLQHVVASPRLFAAELRFWTANLAARLRRPARGGLVPPLANP
jgi:glycosyltransferase involved in cell wall biosynthesis